MWREVRLGFQQDFDLIPCHDRIELSTNRLWHDPTNFPPRGSCHEPKLQVPTGQQAKKIGELPIDLDAPGETAEAGFLLLEGRRGRSLREWFPTLKLPSRCLHTFSIG